MQSRTYLYIKSPSDPTTRVVQLDSEVVRIGRGVFCEVRLTGAQIADVEGYLRRRGRSWSLQPAGEHAQICMNGSVLHEQVYVPFGTSFEIGGITLEVRAEEIGESDLGFGSFHAPIILDQQVRSTLESMASSELSNQSQLIEPVSLLQTDATLAEPESAPVSPEFIPVPVAIVKPSPAVVEVEEPGEDPPPLPRQQRYPAQAPNWKATLDRCEQWLKETRVDRPQTAPWQRSDAGPLPARPVPASGIKDAVAVREWSAPRRPISSGQVDLRPSASDAWPAVASFTPTVPVSTVTVEPSITQRASEPLQRVAVSDEIESSPKVEPWLDPEELEGRAAWDHSETVPLSSLIAEPVSDQPIISTATDARIDAFESDASFATIEAAVDPVPCLSTSFDTMDVDRLSFGQIADSMVLGAVAEDLPAPDESVAETEPVIQERSHLPIPSVTLECTYEPVSADQSGLDDALELAQTVEEANAVQADAEGVPEALASTELDRDISQSNEGMPTVAMILAARQALLQSAESSRVVRKPAASKVCLSDAIAPSEIVFPGRWLAVPLAAVLMLVSGLTVGLCWLWVQDNQAANLVRGLLSRSPSELDTATALDPIPHASWWATTAEHLFERGVLLTSSREADERAQGHDLIDLAENASPWHSGVGMIRLTESIPNRPSEPVTRPSTRDILSLTETARIAFQRGDRDAGTARLVDAAQMAMLTNPRELPLPGPTAAERNPRWLLPQEELFEPICRVAFDQKLLKVEDLLAKLPDYGPLRLTAGRVAGRSSKGAARNWYERVVSLAPDAPQGGSDQLQKAAKAEALALLGRLPESQTAYEALLEEGCPAPLEAACWANLASNAAQGSDINRMNLARRNARRLGIDVATAAGAVQAQEPARNVRPR